MRREPLNALKTAMINTIQYINDDNYIGILDELLAILADSDDRARTHNLSGRDALSPLVRGGVMHGLRTLRIVSMQPRQLDQHEYNHKSENPSEYHITNIRHMPT